MAIEAQLADTLTAGAVAILATAEPMAKVAASRALAVSWSAGALPLGDAAPPSRPGRPERPVLRPPREMAKRRNFGSPAGRIALLHALAHIELNAINLGWDIIARFAGARFADGALPRGFFDDWVAVAAEEAAHFALLAARLADFGADYGDLPAHDGLWEAAAATADDLLARLAVVPLVLEARGLDVTPQMAERLERTGDAASAALLDRIYREEIGHVAVGMRWFERLCRDRALVPQQVFRDQCPALYFKGRAETALQPRRAHRRRLPGRILRSALRRRGGHGLIIPADHPAGSGLIAAARCCCWGAGLVSRRRSASSLIARGEVRLTPEQLAEIDDVKGQQSAGSRRRSSRCAARRSEARSRRRTPPARGEPSPAAAAPRPRPRR